MFRRGVSFLKVFKHGNAFAVVLPNYLVKACNVKEGSELTFVETKDGLFALIPSSEKKTTGSSGLNATGFMVFEDEAAVKKLSDSLEKEIKAGLVKGFRSFDKRYFIVSKSFLDENYPKVLSALKTKELSLTEISEKIKLPRDATECLLGVLKEEGEVIEKKRGLYKLV
ncbi:MAG: hypothetical protein ABH803_01145 [Candidatus Micrarchaeota archaeon]